MSKKEYLTWNVNEERYMIWAPFYALEKTYYAICKNKKVIMVWRGTEWTPEIYYDEKCNHISRNWLYT